MNEDSLVQTYIGRIVAWGSPLWLAIAAIIANAAQQWLNMDLDPTGVAAFVSTVVAAVVSTYTLLFIDYTCDSLIVLCFSKKTYHY